MKKESIFWRCAMAQKYYIGLDIGGTKILGGLFDENCKMVKRTKKSTKSSQGAEVIVGQICKVIDDLLEDSSDSKLVAIGAGCPGIINSKEGVVVFSPNMNWGENFPLKEKMEKKYKVPFFLGNDANILAVGEYKFGAGSGCKNIIGIFIGTGIGGGIIINGRLYEGAVGAAGEIGHTIVLPDGPLCGCGSRGCLESLASRTAMQRDILSQLKKGRTSVITEYMDKEEKMIKSSHLKNSYDKGDELVIEVVDKACYYLGISVGSLMNVFNPDLVIFGGGVIEALGESMMKKIKVTAERYCMPKIFESCKFEIGKLGDDAGLYGALSLAMEQ
jgi:glucokinase